MICCDFDDFLRALADETRQQILHLLQNGEMSVSDLCDHFDQQQPTISHHLAVLRQANLVTTRQEGKWVYYQANQACVAECCQEITRRFIPLTLPDRQSEVNS
ncbi:MAG: winged helix-turn-helix transcriptional regulator [Anaerolineae bacterium]|nr:winged helix-turn-helix transcriptional regulator [Anaerolineae bacterium]